MLYQALNKKHPFLKYLGVVLRKHLNYINFCYIIYINIYMSRLLSFYAILEDMLIRIRPYLNYKNMFLSI